ncbi:MAG TPA: hypothetical protein VGA50_04850 [Kiloniellales bacterium]
MTALLTWAFKRKKAHLVMGAPIHETRVDWPAESADGVAFLMRTGGFIVDGGAAYGTAGGSALHPDAEEVFMLWQRLLTPRQKLDVLWSALDEQPPDWGARLKPVRAAPVFRCHPVHGNQVQVITLGPGRGKRGRRGIKLCPLQYLSTAGDQERRRARYGEWIVALLCLMHEAQARPERFREWAVESLGAPARPWESGAPRKTA